VEAERFGFDADFEFQPLLRPTGGCQFTNVSEQLGDPNGCFVGFRQSSQTAIAGDKFHQAIRTSGDGADRIFNISQFSLQVRLIGEPGADVINQVCGSARQRGHRGNGIHDLVGEHPHQILPGVDLHTIEFALDIQQADQLFFEHSDRQFTAHHGQGLLDVSS
jgi:hypothetical protein